MRLIVNPAVGKGDNPYASITFRTAPHSTVWVNRPDSRQRQFHGVWVSSGRPNRRIWVYRCLGIRKDLLARGADDGSILQGPAQWQSMFSVWSTLSGHKWSPSLARRGPIQMPAIHPRFSLSPYDLRYGARRAHSRSDPRALDPLGGVLARSLLPLATLGIQRSEGDPRPLPILLSLYLRYLR